MWLVTAIGFYSVVRATKGRVQIRARVRTDLVALAKRFKLRGKILATPAADYPYRLITTTAQWKKCLAGFATDAARCKNFKDSVTDPERHSVYLDVWSTLMRLEQQPPDPISKHVDQWLWESSRRRFL